MAKPTTLFVGLDLKKGPHPPRARLTRASKPPRHAWSSKAVLFRVPEPRSESENGETVVTGTHMNAMMLSALRSWG